MAATKNNFSKANNSNQLLAMLKQSIHSTVWLANPKNKHQTPQLLPVKMDCNTVTVIGGDNVKLNYTTRHGNSIIGDTEWVDNLSVAYVDDQFTKGKFTKSTNNDGQTVYTLV